MKLASKMFAPMIIVSLTACAPILDEGKFGAPTLSMDLPDSLTGGQKTANVSLKPGLSARAIELDVPCSFIGSEESDPFRNGYLASRFLVSQVATWTCISDLVITLVDFTVNDGEIHATDNIKGSDQYKSDDPTHYQVSRESENSSKVRLFYGYEKDTPPDVNSDAGFVLNWNVNENDEISGVLSLDILDMDKTPDLNDPIGMRLEFSQSDTSSTNEMYLIFDQTHAFNNGMRVKIIEDKTAIVSQARYTVQALVDVKKQWIDVPSISKKPEIYLFAVTDKLGDGASRALISDLAISLPMNDENHLGDYLMDKTDDYYFDADISKANWEWINKSVTSSEYVTSRNTPVANGSWIPFNPSLDMLINAFELESDYFSNNKCENMGDSCNELMNSIFKDGFAEQEPNQGSDPQDWRSEAMLDPAYLDSVYPNGVDWTDTLLH